jgi:hypothetical protein
MSTDWFTKKPGDAALQGRDDPTMLLLGCDVPDWVNLPPELGGARVKVTGAHMAPCPMCGDGTGDVKHLELEGNLGVAECVRHGFAWYRRTSA